MSENLWFFDVCLEGIEIGRKLLILSYFQGVQKKTSVMKWINLLNFVLDMVKIENKGRTTTQNDVYVSKHQIDDILLLTLSFTLSTKNGQHYA